MAEISSIPIDIIESFLSPSRRIQKWLFEISHSGYHSLSLKNLLLVSFYLFESLFVCLTFKVQLLLKLYIICFITKKIIVENGGRNWRSVIKHALQQSCVHRGDGPGFEVR